MDIEQLQRHLDRDAAPLVALIALAAPRAGLPPSAVARIDQLAAQIKQPVASVRQASEN